MNCHALNHDILTPEYDLEPIRGGPELQPQPIRFLRFPLHQRYSRPLAFYGRSVPTGKRHILHQLNQRGIAAFRLAIIDVLKRFAAPKTARIGDFHTVR